MGRSKNSHTHTIAPLPGYRTRADLPISGKAAKVEKSMAEMHAIVVANRRCNFVALSKIILNKSESNKTATIAPIISTMMTST